MRVAKFQKVSSKQFLSDYMDMYEDDRDYIIEGVHEKIKYPKRATAQSAGYDFYAPFDIELKPGETILITTGIKCKIDKGFVLKIYPRSSLGFKYEIMLANTIGIIDSDYYNNRNNEGHIMVKIVNRSKNKAMVLKEGEAFCQGIFEEYHLTYDDNAEGERVGGIGSTGKSI